MSLLDRYDRMQKRPIGTNTALYRDPATESMGREYRRAQSDFNLARRLLRKEARRGDTGAAVGLLGLGREAASRGVEFGSGRSAGQQADAIGRFTAGRQRDILDLEAQADVNRGVGGAGVGVQGARGVQGATTTSRLDAAMDDEATGETFAETDARKRLDSTLAGNFGTGARDKIMQKRKMSGMTSDSNWWDRRSSYA